MGNVRGFFRLTRGKTVLFILFVIIGLYILYAWSLSCAKIQMPEYPKKCFESSRIIIPYLIMCGNLCVNDINLIFLLIGLSIFSYLLSCSIIYFINNKLRK